MRVGDTKEKIRLSPLTLLVLSNTMSLDGILELEEAGKIEPLPRSEPVAKGSGQVYKTTPKVA